MEKFKEFTEYLVRGKRRKVFLRLDNAKTHRSKLLTGWAEENKKQVEIFYLSPYCLDLNPDEHTNADVKYEVEYKTPKRTKESLKESAKEHMNMLNRTPRWIRRYFLIL